MFAAAAEEGKDDLLNELDELEAEALMGDIEDMEVSAMPIAAAGVPISAAAQPAQAEESKQMAELMAMM